MPLESDLHKDMAYRAGYEDSWNKIWDIGSWPEHLQEYYLQGHMDQAWGTREENDR